MAPPRDTGIRVSGGLHTTRRSIGPRIWVISAVIAGLVIVAGVTVSTVAASSVRGRDQARAELAVTSEAASQNVATALATSPATLPSVAPTPYFASFRGVRLHLPVPPSAVTVMAFHQSALQDTYPMTALVGKANASKLVANVARAKARKKAGTSATVAVASTAPVAAAVYENASDVWTGTALALYRNGRAGPPRTAVDTGAKPGTVVFSPLNGTILRVHPYMLYGRVPDFEIDIKPDELSGVYVAMLHLTNPAVVAGQHVVGGVTPIAKVRKLVGVVSGLQLGEYTAEGGDHCHLQINKLPRGFAGTSASTSTAVTGTSGD